MSVSKFAVVIFFILFVSACATQRIDLVAEGEVKVLTVPSTEVTFLKVDVHQHQERTEIQVVVHPIERVRHFAAGNINLTVEDPDGTQKTIVTDDAKIDHHSTGFKTQHAHFIIQLPYHLPSGSKITVKYVP